MNVNDIYINNVYVIVFIILHYLIGQGGFCYWYNQLPRCTNMMHAISEKHGKICKNLFKKLCKNLNVYIKYNSWTQTGILIKVTIKWATTNCQEFYLKDYPHNKADVMDRNLKLKVTLKNNSNLGHYDFKVIVFSIMLSFTIGLQGSQMS